MKMKKFFALALALAMTVSLAACGGGSTPPASASGSAGSAAASGGSDKVYKVAMVCDSSISDGGWGAACYNAMEAAAADLGWETNYADSVAQSDYANSMTGFCDMGYDMIFLPGNQYSDATVQVAKDYPDIAFAVLNGATTLPTDNITSILPDADQIGYMAGALAGLMSKTNVLGFIGGMEIDTTKAKLAGFEKAAKAINPDITVLSAYAGSFSDVAKGMELANGMISQKADVFFGDASAVDSGARQAIDAANGSGEIAIFDIGQPADLVAQSQNPCLIGSVVTDNAGMLKLAMQDVEAGSFGNKTIYGSYDNNCLAIGTFNDELVSTDIQDSYRNYITQMTEGTFPG